MRLSRVCHKLLSCLLTYCEAGHFIRWTVSRTKCRMDILFVWRSGLVGTAAEAVMRWKTAPAKPAGGHSFRSTVIAAVNKRWLRVHLDSVRIYCDQVATRVARTSVRMFIGPRSIGRRAKRRLHAVATWLRCSQLRVAGIIPSHVVGRKYRCTSAANV